MAQEGSAKMAMSNANLVINKQGTDRCQSRNSNPGHHAPDSDVLTTANEPVVPITQHFLAECERVNVSVSRRWET